MKKLLAILLSVLMLCAMIPFATVSAEEYTVPTMVASTVEAANAGDEIEVQVLLKNNPGVIAVAAEVVYDSNVMELVTYYNEDEEVDMNQIEIGSGFNASSNKYITFGPLGKCSVFYSRGTAKSDCTNELFYTATFKIKEDAPSGTYPLSITFKPKSSVNLAKEFVEFEVATTYITINGASSSSKPGDVNGDGRVNNRDLGMLQQYLGDWDVTIDLDAADVNDDGRVNNRDLGRLQQYLGDWDVELK